MRTVVTVDVDDDGSGVVEVAVGLDDKALAQLPDLDNNGGGDVVDLVTMVRIDDLTEAGWAVTDPEAEDGITWMRASKPFGTPEEAGRVLAELTGEGGPLRDLALSWDTPFGRDRYTFSGRADLGAGLEAFGDEGLAAALDGEPLGEDVSEMAARFDAPLDELVTLDIEVTLPGGDPVSWSPVVGGEPVVMHTSSTAYEVPVLFLTALAVVSLLALAGVAAWHLVLHQRG